MDIETLRDHARDVLTGESPLTDTVRHFEGEGGTNHALWGKLVELGWPALAIPEDAGGLGLGIAELSAVYVEIARAAAPVPFLATMLAADAIAAMPAGDIRDEWLGRIAAGEIAALAEPVMGDATLPTLRQDGDSVALGGTTAPILDGADAAILVLLARDETGALHRVLVDPAADGLTVPRTQLYDKGHCLASIPLDGLTLPASRASAATAEDRLRAHLLIGLASEAVGGSEGLLELTIEYLKVRTQFGKPIGSFQALKHRVADHAASLNAGRVLCEKARDALAACDGEIPVAVLEDCAAAKALNAANYLTLSRDAVQLHGGIAFTAEHAAHLFTKHAWLVELLAGGRRAAETLATGTLFGSLDDVPVHEVGPKPEGSPIDHAHDLDAFRAALRAWLPHAIPADWRGRIRKGAQAAAIEVQREWHRALDDAGLAVAHWPAAWGGSDMSLAAQIVYYEEMIRADAPNSNLYCIALYHMPATLFAHGTQEQRDRYLSGVRQHGEVWAQGFSEPGSGSDLASLSTRAERQGDTYVLNGQKIWSSGGGHSDYYLLMARTDAKAARKHDGISMFIVDLKNTPGITIREIEQINGDQEFAEVFMDDAVIPAANLIGEENKGWMIAQSTLTTERGLLIFEHTERLANAFRRDARKAKDTWLRDPADAAAFRHFWPRIRAIQLLARALLDELALDPHGGGETATYLKLAWGPLLQDYNEFIARMAGLAGQEWVEPLRCAGHNSGDAMPDFFLSYGWTIAGGSNEVMRNIVSERMLGLPR